MSYILFVSWISLVGSNGYYKNNNLMAQEFNSLEACQFASIELQKMQYMRDMKMVCLPKGK